MRISYCDRCGTEHREGVKGGRVVRVTWEPLQRTMDLCGSCRTDLQRALDAFEKQDWPQSTTSKGFLMFARRRRGLEEALRFWVARADRFEAFVPPEKAYTKALGVGSRHYTAGAQFRSGERGQAR